MAAEELAQAINIVGKLLVRETTNEARLFVLQGSGYDRAQWSAAIEPAPCPLCASLDGKVFDTATAPYNPPAHINCDCIWIGVEADEVGSVDAFDPTDPYLQDLVDKHGHFLTNPDKFSPLRIPASPGGRDFVFRRRNTPDGLQSSLEWRRPRYQIDGLDPATAQTGISDVGKRWEQLRDGAGPILPEAA